MSRFGHDAAGHFLDRLANALFGNRHGRERDLLKSNDISPAKLVILVKLDLATLRSYEQARELSIELLKKWLTTCEFRHWALRSTTNPGAEVTPQEKEARANEIAETSANNAHWHSHGRMIGLNRLEAELSLKIDDYGTKVHFPGHIRTCSDTLTDYRARQNQLFYPHSRFLNSEGNFMELVKEIAELQGEGPAKCLNRDTRDQLQAVANIERARQSAYLRNRHSTFPSALGSAPIFGQSDRFGCYRFGFLARTSKIS